MKRRCSYAPYTVYRIAAILRPALPLYVYFTSFALALSFRRVRNGGGRRRCKILFEDRTAAGESECLGIFIRRTLQELLVSPG